MNFWLSFADPDKPKGSQFLGAVIAPGEDFLDAIAWAHDQGVNPGGEVQGVPMSDLFVIPPEFAGRLLSRPECEEVDAILGKQLAEKRLD